MVHTSDSIRTYVVHVLLGLRLSTKKMVCASLLSESRLSSLGHFDLLLAPRLGRTSLCSERVYYYVLCAPPSQLQLCVYTQLICRPNFICAHYRVIFIWFDLFFSSFSNSISLARKNCKFALAANQRTLTGKEDSLRKKCLSVSKSLQSERKK